MAFTFFQRMVRRNKKEAPLPSPSIYDNEVLNTKMLICGKATKISDAEEVADAFAHVPRGCKASTLFRISLEGESINIGLTYKKYILQGSNDSLTDPYEAQEDTKHQNGWHQDSTPTVSVLRTF